MFKIGDRVKCKDNTSFENVLVKGAIYTVDSVIGGGRLILKDVDDVYAFFPFRFVKVEKVYNSGSISLNEAILHFIEEDAYNMMKKVGVNRVTIFNQACREAFVKNDQSEYAHALREYARKLDDTGILCDTL